MDKNQIYEICKVAAPKYNFDPLLIMAIVEQESAYNDRAIRFEIGFLRHYVLPLRLSFSGSLLLSFSYGLMQVMGESLREMGYFITSDNTGIHSGVDAFIESPSTQIEYGCRWLSLKNKIAANNQRKMLLFWNGGSDPDYPDAVINRYVTLKTEFL
jgi:soluble lytic murein transglycosylase-like protein